MTILREKPLFPIFYPNSYASQAEAMLFTLFVRKFIPIYVSRHKGIQIVSHYDQRGQREKLSSPNSCPKAFQMAHN